MINLIMIKLVIFDMDGVLVDSEPAITDASIKALAEIGITAKPADFKEFTGMGDEKFIAGVAGKHGGTYSEALKLRAYEIYGKNPGMVKVFPKARRLLHNLLTSGVKCAVASAGDTVRVMLNLSIVNPGKSVKIVRTGETVPSEGRRLFPLYVVTGSDVVNKKPDPEIFLKAAALSGINPVDSIVVEDALSGVKAGKAAGAKVIAVTTSFPRKALIEAGADYVVDSLYDVWDVLKGEST
ncbi:hydrolase [Clostridia bacterium]|nr:hydrolase [Clostridia bacterium]